MTASKLTVQTDQNGTVNKKLDKHDAHVIHLTLDSTMKKMILNILFQAATFPNVNNGFIRLIDYSRIYWKFKCIGSHKHSFQKIINWGEKRSTDFKQFLSHMNQNSFRGLYY